MGRTNRTSDRFDLGLVIVSPGVRNAIGIQAVYHLLNRHVRGDWGEGYIGDRDRNERFFRLGLRLESHYLLPDGIQVVISTDPTDSLRTSRRQSTEVCLFSEYGDIFG
jgi:hypothetical protein